MLKTRSEKESYDQILNQLTEKLEEVCRIDQEQMFDRVKFFDTIKDSRKDEFSHHTATEKDLRILEKIRDLASGLSRQSNDLRHPITLLCEERIPRYAKDSELSGHPGAIYFILIFLEASEALRICGLKGREQTAVGAALLVYGGYISPDYFGLTPDFNVFDLPVEELDRIHNNMSSRLKRTSIYGTIYRESAFSESGQLNITLGDVPEDELYMGDHRQTHRLPGWGENRIPKIKLGSILPNARRRPSK
jgi:hypothetical protein